MENNKYLIPLSVVVAGILVAGAIYFGAGTKTSTPTAVSNEPQEISITIPAVTSADHILGDRNAPIVIIEYSDTECPWCQIFHKTMHQIVDEYAGTVAWVYRHMPFHTKSLKESQATECAFELGGNDAFWKYLDRVFEITPANNGLDLATLPTIAEYVGLDVEAFNSCLSSERHQTAIQANLELAKPGGIEGTPYSIIRTSSGQEMLINGAEPFERVKTKIENLIQN